MTEDPTSGERLIAALNATADRYQNPWKGESKEQWEFMFYAVKTIIGTVEANRRKYRAEMKRLADATADAVEELLRFKLTELPGAGPVTFRRPGENYPKPWDTISDLD